MTSTTAFEPTLLDPGQVELRRWRSTSRRVALIWALLVLNVLTFYDEMPRLLPLPGIVGTMLTQGALVAAMALALSVNRPVAVRANVYLLVLSALPLLALLTSLRAEFVFGALFRTGRLATFVAVLWLLSPWWGRRDLLLVRAHLTALWVVLGSVVLGAVLAGGMAFEQNRLAGVLWPIPWTQVAHYAAVAAGLSAVLWMTGVLRRAPALTAVVLATTIMLLTQTRTALFAVIAGVVVAGVSLFTAHTRVRRAFAIAVVVATLAASTVSSVITAWLARGQSTNELGELTGRTKVWTAILDEPRTVVEALVGFGLSNKSFDGLPIDSNWLATFRDLGLLGVGLSVALVLVIAIAATVRPQGPRRALALFLVTYCSVASFTETGLSDASAYLLELSLAASLVMRPVSPWRRA
ncbi:MAG: O-antigen ligase domain-containing protein [Streptosporangiales bacterium]|nr:O-antigen ligase domain-containing protein [Streptosporangiales bacterium]